MIANEALSRKLCKMDSEERQTLLTSMPQVEIPDEKDERFCVLSFEQVKRLNDLMCDVVDIHGRGNFPTIDVKLCDLVKIVKRKLDEEGTRRELRPENLVLRPAAGPSTDRPAAGRRAFFDAPRRPVAADMRSSIEPAGGLP